MEHQPPIEVIEFRVNELEKKHHDLCVKMEMIERDLRKIMDQISALKYILIGAILVESPQAVEAIRHLLGL